MTLLLEGSVYPCVPESGRTARATKFDAMCTTGRFGVNIGPANVPETPSGWRGGCCIHENGLVIGWVGRFFEVGGILKESTRLDGSSVALHIAEGYIKWSGELLGRLRGEFALCIWEPASGTCRLVSDPLRSVPLYYCHGSQGAIHFGNHVGRLARLPGVPRDFDEDCIIATISGMPGEASATCVKAVRAIPGGCLAVFRANDAVQIDRYWRPLPLGPISNDELVERFRERLKSRMEAARQGTACAAIALSGGLDSSSLLRIAWSARPDNLRAITNRLPYDLASDELRFAKAAVEGTNVPLAIEVPSDDACSRDVLQDSCEPGPVEWFPLIGATARRAKAFGCSLLITGAFGDALAGYDGGWRQYCASEGHWRDLGRLPIDSNERSLPGVFAGGAKVWFGSRWPAAPNLWHSARAAVLIGRERGRLSFLARSVRARHNLAQREFADEHNWRIPDVPYAIPMARYPDSGVAGVQRVARLIEKSTGLALMYPFADPSIFQIAATLPWELRHGPDGGRILLRRAMRGLLPEVIRLRSTKCFYNGFFRGILRNRLKLRHFNKAAFTWSTC